MMSSISPAPSARALLIVSLGVLAFASGCFKSKEGDAADGGKASTTNLSSAAAPKGGSCKQPSEGLCTEFAENPFGASEGLCTSLMSGTFSKDACPRENMLGTCETKAKNVTYYYFGNARGPLPADAKAACSTIEEGNFTLANGAEQVAKEKAMPSPDRIVASCLEKSGGCEDYFGSAATVSINKSMCDGTWQDGKACPTEGVVASCLSQGQVRRYTQKSLKASYMTLADVERLCNSDGFAYQHLFKSPNAVAQATGGKNGAVKGAGAAKAKK